MHAQEKSWEALKQAEAKNGRLALSQFRRLKQLGTGDVGLVDMVELQDGSGRCVPSAAPLSSPPSRGNADWQQTLFCQHLSQAPHEWGCALGVTDLRDGGISLTCVMP